MTQRLSVRSDPSLERGAPAPAARVKRLRLYELPELSLSVRAAPEICFQVIASAGRTLERYASGDRLVEFEAIVDGRRILTKELVRTEEPERIDYEWVEGPLPLVEETIRIEPADNGDTRLRYEGRFAVAAPWPIRPFAARSVSKKFAAVVNEHLVEAKDLAERRADRSRLYPRKVTR